MVTRCRTFKWFGFSMLRFSTCVNSSSGSFEVMGKPKPSGTFADSIPCDSVISREPTGRRTSNSA